MESILIELGRRLHAARKARFPQDTQTDFALRIRVSRGTLQSMERGCARVALGAYFEAARILDMEDQFNGLFAAKSVAKGLLEELEI